MTTCYHELEWMDKQHPGSASYYCKKCDHSFLFDFKTGILLARYDEQNRTVFSNFPPAFLKRYPRTNEEWR